MLLLAPIAAVVAALFCARAACSRHWTQTFMRSAAGFFAQFFPLFLLGALFGKLMEDSGLGHGDRRLHDQEARRRAA